MACAWLSSRMPCSARNSSNDEPIFPFRLAFIRQHLFRSLQCEPQIPIGGLLRLLDEAVQEYHALPDHAEDYSPDFSVTQIDPYFPQAVAKTAAVWHTKRPAEFNLLNGAANQLPIFHSQPEYPLPHGLPAGGGFIEEGRKLL